MIKQVLLRWLWCIYEYLLVFPVVLIVAGIILPFNTTVVLLLILPLHFLSGLVLTSVLKKFSNPVVVLSGTVYSIIMVWISRVAFLSGSLEEIIAVIIGTVFFFAWGIRAGIGETISRYFLYSFGLVIHLISLFVIKSVYILKPYFALAMWVSIIYCIAGLPLTNRRFLINETYEKSSLSKIPGSVNRGNWVVALMILAGTIILSFWRALLDAFTAIAESIAWVIRKILEFIESLSEPIEGGLGGGPQNIENLPPAEESNPIIDIILNIITVLLIAAILFLIIRYIVKNYKRIYQALYNLLSAVFNRFQKWSSTEQGYFDREESLLKTEMQKKPPLLKRLFRRYPKWRDMKDNESRIRFIYTKFVIDHIKRGLKFRLSDTPAEVVEKAKEYDIEGEKDHTMLKDAYNSVRYGAKKADDETVLSLKDTYL